MRAYKIATIETYGLFKTSGTEMGTVVSITDNLGRYACSVFTVIDEDNNINRLYNALRYKVFTTCCHIEYEAENE